MKYLFAFLAGSVVFSAAASVYAMFAGNWPMAMYLALLAVLGVLGAMLVHVVEWLPVLREAKR